MLQEISQARPPGAIITIKTYFDSYNVRHDLSLDRTSFRGRRIGAGCCQQRDPAFRRR
ncbi:protein of unknown function [Agrobacterium pusense]|uniref:Uncharacterized protein n=1 Tax=Agrobacterium pusense TaxID=648995 RepID=U4Q2V2_9HYPH|nr:protein of unknown function [Agrobacterium pusense]